MHPKRAYRTRFVLPPARNRVFWAHLGPSGRHVGPSWAPCWPILEAPLAPSWATLSQTARWAPRKPLLEALPSGLSHAHQRCTARVGASETAPLGTPQWPVARTPTLHRTPRKPLRWALPSGLSRRHHRSNAHAKRKTLQNGSFGRSKARKHRKTRGFAHFRNYLWRLSPAACRVPAELQNAKRSEVPCRGTAPNLTLDLNAKGHAHLFWDAREVTAEGSEIPLRGYRAFSASVPLHPAT